MPSILRRVFPLVLCSISLLAVEAAAQAETTSSPEAISAELSTRPRRASTSTTAGGAPVLSTDPVIISTAEEEAPTIVSAARQSSFRLLAPAPLDQMLLAAIDTRIGAPYVWGASGPRTFDCSGFVWSVFRSAGFEFERMNARNLWARSMPADGAERYRFGTLVFFNHQQHVGIVADDRGFYHASRSQGVTYSTFDGYWGDKIDGFRKLAAVEAE